MARVHIRVSDWRRICGWSSRQWWQGRAPHVVSASAHLAGPLLAVRASWRTLISCGEYGIRKQGP